MEKHVAEMPAPSYFPIIFAAIVVFNIFGQFGNINLIVLYCRKPNLRTHYGCLLVILSASQSICLAFEFVNIFFAIQSLILDEPIHRDTCLRTIFPYTFFNSFQSDVIVSISIDFLICLCFPIRYRSFKRKYYLPFLLAFPFLHGFCLVASAFRYLDDATISLCNPPSSVFPGVLKYNYIVNLIAASTTLITYSSGFFIVYLKSRAHAKINVDRKVLRSISLLVIISVFNRFLGMLLVNLLNFFGIPPDIVFTTQNLLVLCALFCFSQNFYVCYFRSHEYRNMLNCQLAVFIRIFRPDYVPSTKEMGAAKSMTENMPTTNQSKTRCFRLQRVSSLPGTLPVMP